MKTRWIGITGVALVLAALMLGVLGPQLFPTAFWGSAQAGMMGSGTIGPGMTGGMMGGGMIGPGMMAGGMMGGIANDSSRPFDQRFLDQMIAHHQGALLSAQRMIAGSARPELRDLAQRIVTAQQREIDQMLRWRQDWYGAAGAGAQPGMMGGMMDADQMRQMMGPNGDLDRMFLQMMIPHHEAAIAMAQQALEQAEHPELKTLAQAIITAQRAEIAQMWGYLGDWYGIEGQ